jgi:hypothetical protein
MGTAGLLLAALLVFSEARFDQADCRLVELRDEAGGSLVTGMEDLSLTHDGRELLISAYDRLADNEGVEGGVYRIEKPWPKGAVWRAPNLAPGSKPHGIAARPEGGFTFIDRAAPGGTRLLTVLPSGAKRYEPFGEGAPAPLCAANDLAFGPQGEGLVTIDRGGCGGFLERVFGGRAASVRRLSEGLPPVLEKLSLANGIAFHEGRFWAADMRARQLVPVSGGEAIPLPGAPDNLNPAAEGIVAALQPSLWRFGLYRYGHRKRAPSLIVLLLPESGESETLFEDETGAFFSGATAAVLDGDVLMAGSAAGDRLLFCKDGS